MAKRNKIKTDSSIVSKIFITVCFIFLAFYALTIIFTMAYSFMTSLKVGELYEDGNRMGLPIGDAFTFSNYSDVWQVLRLRVTIGGEKVYATAFIMLINSLSFSVGGALLGTIFTCITAYGVVRFNNWMGKVIYGIVIVCLALPIVGSLPSELQILIKLNLYDTRMGLIFLASSFLGMHFLIFHATLSAVPKDFSEAAKIDGASELRIMLAVNIPLIKTVFATIFLLKFMTLWNNYETPLIHTPNYPVLAYGVFSVYKGEHVVTGSGISATSMPHKLAASMIVLVPMLIIFLFSHKKLMGNISVGGVKG